MKAITQEEFGSPDVLILRDEERPRVTDLDVLVRVRAASPNPWDWHFMRGLPYISRAQAGWRTPKNKILGSDIAGEVEAVGKGVTKFRPGDRVFGFVGHGGFAEYAVAGEGMLGRIPAALAFEEAAAVPLAAMTALQGLRDTGNVRAGERVLIVGASGGVGTFAVQIAKVFGAHVTAVCSARNAELVRSLGADEVIDYTTRDFTQGPERYDVIFQLAGTDSPSRCRRVLTGRGRLVLSSGESSGRWIGPMGRIIKAIVLDLFVKHSLRSLTFKPSSQDLQQLGALIEASQVKPVIDRSYQLSETANAIRYLETGRARGKIVITV